MNDAAIALFADHQARILAILDSGDALLGADIPDVAALGKIRWALVHAIRAYQVHKHSRIFDPVIAADDPRTAPAARSMKAMCAASGKAGHDFILEWSGKSVGEHWPEYCAATLAMNARIRLSLHTERLCLSGLRDEPPRSRGYAPPRR